MIVPARLAFGADGTPYSEEYRDVYHAADGGPEQANHVFLGGNDLPERWRQRDALTIVEVGFGLGLNFLATWRAWQLDPQRSSRLHFVSVEKHPFGRGDLAALHRRWPQFAELSTQLLDRWPAPIGGISRLEFEQGRVALTLLFGAAERLLPALAARCDAIYLDGFAPAKNSELWSMPLMQTLTGLARPGATLATWSVAKALREALSACGWRIELRPGFARKRQMLAARLPGAARTHAPQRRALIVGAGLAGSACAERLASRGWSATVIDRRPGPAMAASGNPTAVLRPLPSLDDNHVSRITRAAFLHARRHFAALDAESLPLRWRACGALHLANDPEHENHQRQLVAQRCFPADYVSFVERDQATYLAGWPLTHGGWWFPGGGWVDPASLCHANLGRYPTRIDTLFGAGVDSIVHADDGWRAIDAAGKILATAPVLILACAAGARRLLPRLHLTLRIARGQINYLPQTGDAPKIVVCRQGYVAPALDDRVSFGASFVLDDEDEDIKPAESRENLARLDAMLPGYAGAVAAETLTGRTGLRCVTEDRLPLVGALPQADPSLPAAAGATALSEFPRQPGLHGCLGLGSRGLVWATLAAELLAAQLEAEPLPLEQELVDALDPARFALRRLRRLA